MYQVDLQKEYLTEAVRRAGQMRQFFEDAREGGYYIYASDAVPLIARPKEMHDGALPSGNSAALMVLGKLAALTGEEGWREAFDRQARYCVGEIQEYPAGYSFTLLAMTDYIKSNL